MKSHLNKKNGFTLVEIIAVLTLLGIGLGFGAILFINLTQNYVVSRKKPYLNSKPVFAFSNKNNTFIGILNHNSIILSKVVEGLGTL